MYCSKCGSTIADDLNYCSRCGAATERVPVNSAPVRVFAIGAALIAFVGLAAFVPFIRMMLESRLDPTAIGIFAFGYLLTMLIMFGSMLSMAMKFAGIRDDRRRRSRERKGEEYEAPAAFRGVTTAQLQGADPRFSSVTDSTTRTLDEAMAERKR